jgi:MFS transporter, ACS family, aldohexuronate transporter
VRGKTGGTLRTFHSGQRHSDGSRRLADLYKSDSVASVSGLSGTAAGIGTIIAFKLIGHFSDARQASATHSFDPIVVVAGLIPFIGMILVLLLVRNTRATHEGLVQRI